MHTQDVSGLLGVVKTISGWSGTEALSDERRNRNSQALKSYKGMMGDLGLSASTVSLEKVLEVLAKEGCTFQGLKAPSAELVGRLIDETRDKVFFALSPKESQLFQKPRQGWEKSIERFPTIISDVEETAKCLALSRYAASVFHSVQIVESCLIELGKFLKVSDPHSGWTSVSNALSKSVKTEWKEKTSFEKKNHAFLEQVHGTVEGLKNAWRNKISHAGGKLELLRGDFNEEIAEEIFFATRAFLRRLADGLPPLKKKKPSAS